MDTIQNTIIRELQALVANISERCPELASRAEKAALILLSAKVAETDAPDTYQVVSACGVGSYTVDMRAERCDCADFTHRAPEWNGGKWCKHLLSVLMLRKIGARGPSARLERIAPFRRRSCARLTRKVAA